MEEVEKLLKEQLENYRGLLELSKQLQEVLSENKDEEVEAILAQRGDVISKIMETDEKIVKSEGGSPEDSGTYYEIGEVLEEIAAIDGKSEEYLKEGKEGIIKNIKGLQKGKNAAKGYGSDRGKLQGGSGKFISIKE